MPKVFLSFDRFSHYTKINILLLIANIISPKILKYFISLKSLCKFNSHNQINNLASFIYQ